MHSQTPIIATRTHAMLKEAINTMLITGRMSLAIGPPGIGKTFGLNLIEGELSQDEDQVLVFTASENTGRSETKFFQKLLFDLNVSGAGYSDPISVFASFMLHSYPFKADGPRKVLVIDECQYLQTNIVNCLKSIFDRGDTARKFDPTRGAFGLVFVGNAFITRGGKDARAAYEALNTRMSRWPLGRPAEVEITILASKFFPESEPLQTELARAGLRWGNFREMAEAASMALHFAGNETVEVAHLQAAIQVVGGKV